MDLAVHRTPKGRAAGKPALQKDRIGRYGATSAQLGGKGEVGRPCGCNSPQLANCSVCRRDASNVLNVELFMIDALTYAVLPATSIMTRGCEQSGDLLADLVIGRGERRNQCNT